ncbi:MAG TPA: hypothetical protein VMB47_03505 [Candidatus Aquilonibacter sp.]|nr:hypothetical protein [Candidatus Aquilonibacter sp.]
MFVAAAITLVLVLLLPAIEPAVEALVAIAFVSAVAYGFTLHPRRDVFVIRTTIKRADLQRNLVIEHDQLAVRVETARLWLLFLLTSIAVGFLVTTAANGTLWRFSFLAIFSTPGLNSDILCWMGAALYLIGVVFWIWVTERRVLRDAEACSAPSFRVSYRHVTFQFNYGNGDYGGGDDLYFGLVRPYEAAVLIFYNVNKPELCKIGMSFLFHRVAIIGRGLTDLDRESIAVQTLSPGTAS